MDVNPTNGFEVDVDNEAIVSCVTTSTGQEEEAKQHNTCHTSAVLWLKRGMKQKITKIKIRQTFLSFQVHSLTFEIKTLEGTLCCIAKEHSLVLLRFHLIKKKQL